LEDLSSPDDSDLEELFDDDVEKTAVILAAKEILDIRPNKNKGQPWGGSASPGTALLAIVF
jgi:hypothetical protein